MSRFPLVRVSPNGVNRWVLKLPFSSWVTLVELTWGEGPWGSPVIRNSLQTIIDFNLPYTYRGPMRKRPIEENPFALPLWISVGDSFEENRGGQPYSASRPRYFLRLFATVWILIGGFALIRWQTQAGLLTSQVFATVIFLYFMKGKILMLFEPL